LFETIEARTANRFEYRIANTDVLSPRDTPIITFPTGLDTADITSHLPALYDFLATQIIGYESGIDSRFELPLHADLIGPPDYFALTISDPHGGEYFRLLPPDFRTVPETPRLAIDAVADTYETPISILRELPRYDP
jgi:hypothetical protein